MYVYLIENLVNGKGYVGSTIKTPAVRWKKHVSAAKCGVRFPLYNSIRKYGKERFVVTVLEKCFSVEEMHESETRWIADLNTRDQSVGYNVNSGGGRGRLGVPQKREAREKISATLKDRWVNASEEDRAAHLLQLSSARANWKGETPESRRRRSESAKLAGKNPSTIAKRKAAWVNMAPDERSERIAQLKAGQRKMIDNTGFREMCSAKATKHWNGVWADPARRAELLAKRAATVARKKEVNNSGV